MDVYRASSSQVRSAVEGAVFRGGEGFYRASIKQPSEERDVREGAVFRGCVRSAFNSYTAEKEVKTNYRGK
jgi:hypothetical protein